MLIIIVFREQNFVKMIYMPFNK